MPDNIDARVERLERVVSRAATLIGLVGCVAILALVLSLKAARGEIVITSDPGGGVQRYMDRVDQAIAAGEHVTVDGPCHSACTLWLKMPPDRICATPRARFGFHWATVAGLGLPDSTWNDRLMNSYPLKVRAMIGGSLGADVIYINGTAILPRCKGGKPHESGHKAGRD